MSSSNSKNDLLVEKIQAAAKELETVGPLGSARVQDKIFQFSRELLREESGIECLYKQISTLVKAGLFKGGGWEKEDRLLPSLVRGSLLAKGIYPTVEALSELRILAIYEGISDSENLSGNEAHTFLIETFALNLDFLFPRLTEENRELAKSYQYAQRIFSFISKRIQLSSLFDEFIKEVHQLAHQRPIATGHIKKILRSGQKMIESDVKFKEHSLYPEFESYYKACFIPTNRIQEDLPFQEYRKLLFTLREEELEIEAQSFGGLLQQTGLASPYMAIFLRFCTNRHPSLLSKTMGLNERGREVVEGHRHFVCQLIRLCIRPSTFEFIYGFSCFLERHMLTEKEVDLGIKKLVDIDIVPELRKKLAKRKYSHDSVSPNAILIAGLLAVLGQPLGVGQGNNPTCQAARGISLWSQHDAKYLIELVISAARDNIIEMPFEGDLLRSSALPYFNLEGFEDPDLDPVSLLLVPHLDSIYGEMLRRSTGRGEDAHKWANPAFYGRWINFGFESVLDRSQSYVIDYENFVRRFYATHHPDYTDSHDMIYANPVGIFITNSHSDLIGLHAVSILRVSRYQNEEFRIYFFNPNNEGRQNWGQGITPTVHGYGEEHGESSLPFHEFVSRLYAFHFNPYEEGEGFAVPQDETNKVIELAKQSWGKLYTWSLL